MVSSVGWKPAVFSSRSRKPLGTPVMPPAARKRWSSEPNTCLRRFLMCSALPRWVRWVTSKIFASASSR